MDGSPTEEARRENARVAALDRASKPLRDAVTRWAHLRELGSSSRWVEARGVWEIEPFLPGRRLYILVEVTNDGCEARVFCNGIRHVAINPTRLRAILNRLER